MSTPRSWPARAAWRLWAFPPATVWGLLPWMMLVAVPLLTTGPVGEPDVFWHIRIGNDFLDSGRITGDPSWTFGPAQDGWQSTQVAAEVVLAWLYNTLGWPGIVTFRAVTLLVLMLSVWAAATATAGRRGTVAASRAAALVTVVLTAVFLTGFEERPQSLSLIVLPWVGVAAVRLAYTGTWPRWWIWGPGVMVWSWFHGAGVVVAPLLVLAAAAHIATGRTGLAWRPAVIAAARAGWPVILAVLVAPMLGPSGTDYYRHASAISQAATGFIVEWAPAPTSNPTFVWLLIAYGLWAAALIAVAARRGRVTRDMAADAIIAGMALLAAVSVARNALVALLVLAPFVAYRAGQALRMPAREYEPVSRRAATATALGSLGTSAVLLVVLAGGGVPVGEDGPDRIWAGIAADTARQHRVFVDYNLGGQAQMLTGAAVSIDGRSDRYGAETLFAHVDAQAGRPGWRETWARYPGVTDVVLAEDAGLIDRLTEDGWREACTDGGYTWLVPAGVDVEGCATGPAAGEDP